MWEKIKNWLNAHPKVKGLVIVAEAALVGALENYIENGGTIVFTKDGLKKLALFLAGAVYLAVKNYMTQYVSAKALADAKAAGQ